VSHVGEHRVGIRRHSDGDHRRGKIVGALHFDAGDVVEFRFLLRGAIVGQTHAERVQSTAMRHVGDTRHEVCPQLGNVGARRRRVARDSREQAVEMPGGEGGRLGDCGQRKIREEMRLDEIDGPLDALERVVHGYMSVLPRPTRGRLGRPC